MDIAHCNEYRLPINLFYPLTSLFFSLYQKGSSSRYGWPLLVFDSIKNASRQAFRDAYSHFLVHVTLQRILF